MSEDKNQPVIRFDDEAWISPSVEEIKKKNPKNYKRSNYDKKDKKN